MLRIEAGLPLYGNEIDETISPVEAGLMRWVSLSKGNFIGREAIVERAECGPEKRLIGLTMEGRSVPRRGNAVKSSAGDGIVSSGTFSPTLGRGIAMVYITPRAVEGTPVELVGHAGVSPGVLCRLPFYDPRAPGRAVAGGESVS